MWIGESALSCQRTGTQARGDGPRQLVHPCPFLLLVPSYQSDHLLGGSSHPSGEEEPCTEAHSTVRFAKLIQPNCHAVGSYPLWKEVPVESFSLTTAPQRGTWGLCFRYRLTWWLLKSRCGELGKRGRKPNYEVQRKIRSCPPHKQG